MASNGSNLDLELQSLHEDKKQKSLHTELEVKELCLKLEIEVLRKESDIYKLKQRIADAEQELRDTVQRGANTRNIRRNLVTLRRRLGES